MNSQMRVATPRVILVVLVLVLNGQGAANAATEADYNVEYCDGGSLQGTGYNRLERGLINFGWCANSSGSATTITVKYKKNTGGDIQARFGYEWVNKAGTVSGFRHWDQSANNIVTIQAGETWGARFRRSPAESSGDSYTNCMRGLLKADGAVYSTSVVCPD